jgi:hypothetical protein
MTRTILIAATLAIFLVPVAKGETLLLCGDDTVFVLETSTAAKGTIAKTWSWKAQACSQLPEAMRKTFATTDDCKPTADGARVLISSSSGGCAVVERPSGKVIWYAQVPNAHSLDLLPRDRLVVASSVNAKGNRLVLFDLAHSDRPIWETPLPSAHGVVWDEGRQRLWALGFAELQCYALRDWESEKPSLALKARYPLPDENGHDLQPIPGSSDLVVTMTHHVYLFDRDTHAFRLHPALGEKGKVKSVSVHPATGQTAVIQAMAPSWWSDTLDLLSPAAKIRLPGERLYKARWLAPRADK